MRLRSLFENKSTAVMAFGRMNPPTIGHAKLVDKIKSFDGDHYVFLSQSQKPKTDPLAFEDKLRYAKFAFPAINIGHPEVKTIIQALQKIEQLGYKNIIYVAGSDRVQSFEELINKYNGKDYTFDSIKIVSAGERDPDADGAEGMSASKMRAAAAAGDLKSFKQGAPRPEIADEMFAAVRQGMGIEELEPAESIEESESDTYYIVTVHSGGTIKRYKLDGSKFKDSNEAADFVTDIFDKKGISVRVKATQYRKKASDTVAAERELTKGEEKEKERIVKGMKKAKGSFKDRYGDDAEAVMYATATKLAKK